MEQISSKGGERRAKQARNLGLRGAWIALRRRIRGLSLTQRFLVYAVIIIAGAIIALGTTISSAVRLGITDGVARTAAAGFDSLVANSLAPVFERQVLTEEDRARLSALFEIGSDAETTRLVQLRIFRANGVLLYETAGDIVDIEQGDRLSRALRGEVSSDVVELSVKPAGPFGSHPITLLRLYTPLHEGSTQEIIGGAVLYYSARSLTDIQAQTQAVVWSLVLVVGALVVLLLLAFVSAAERTIVRQARHLSDNLERSRALSDKVHELHAASEQLRIDSIEANEQLLARVGSDIHDGPLQLMTLAILQLTRSLSGKGGVNIEALKPTVVLTTEAMTDLRNISVGLVLPELSGLTLAQTLELAIGRHEGATGLVVNRDILNLDHPVESDVQVCLYRVVQESLSNAFRHSDGRELNVAARQAQGSILVEISSGGAAPRAEPSQLRPKIGLRGMRLRLEAVGGSMVVEMQNDRTTVRAVVPTAT